MAKKTAKKFAPKKAPSMAAAPSTSKKKSMMPAGMHYGSIAFGVGLLIVIIGTLVGLEQSTAKWVVEALVLLGVVIGILNVTGNEAVAFMVASITVVMLLGPFLLLLSQYVGQNQYFYRFMTYITAMMVPAALVVALKVLFYTAKDE